MPLWTDSTAPTFDPTDVLTDFGWLNPQTGEVHAFLTGQQATAASAAPIAGVVVAGNFEGVLPANIATTYVDNQNILIRVAFIDAVLVVGSPQVTLSINGTPQHATFSRYRAKNVLEFVYTVQSGDAATAGQFSISSPLTLNGGHIYKPGTTTAITPLTFTPPTTNTIVIDSTATVSGLALTHLGDYPNYVTGDIITLTATFSKSVTVAGNPYINVFFNGSARQCLYTSGSGGTAIVFTYTTVSSDFALEGTFTIDTTITPNGGSIYDAVGAGAILTVSPPSTTTVSVNDTTAPVITGAVIVSSAHGTHPLTGDKLTVSLTFDKPVVVTGTPHVALNITSGNEVAAYTSGDSTSTVLAFEYTLGSGDVAAAAGFSVGALTLNGGTIKDNNNDAATLTFTAPTTSTWAIN
jgi:hypothetical protein